ncbi:MAG: hypothetical protein IJ258_07320 [Methanobrevibacter sp.]|uniref:hypothetical protein n=1 Tax=Methanobrevibacter sp. TaxID=66852 RepID=UPI0025CEE47A|nr:hypothetical protein [Methanobrevibacter sp.]MBQ8017902.1 hypothetical protein [Methanobrevibacter sp.]
MNMKNTVILLIFLLSVLGLIIGVYYSEDISSDNSQEDSLGEVSEDSSGVLAITLEKKEKNELSDFLT